MLWRQKFRSEWIHLGDRNTSYFHKKAKIRKVRNRITSLQISDGSWCDEDSILKDEAVRFYKSLFSCERATHSFSDCPNMFPRVDANVISSFYNGDLHTWLLLNLNSQNILAPLDVPWNILFGSVCWHIWKCRNEYVFAGSNSHPDYVALHSIIWARHYYTSTAVPQLLPSPLHDAPPCQWSPPPSPWICLNTDGGVYKSTNIAKAGGLFRDNCGNWIRGYGRCIGITDPLTAELWAIHDGLILAWELGFELLQVQSDCAKAISTLTARTGSRDSHALIRSIHSLCQRGWAVDFVWIPRAANQVADQLVKDLHQSQYERVCIDVPPAHMSDLLTRDIHGRPYSRGSA
ncbi:hypothetical protein GQ457_16G015800 [Hibiscus cannabinus]